MKTSSVGAYHSLRARRRVVFWGGLKDRDLDPTSGEIPDLELDLPRAGARSPVPLAPASAASATQPAPRDAEGGRGAGGVLDYFGHGFDFDDDGPTALALDLPDREVRPAAPAAAPGVRWPTGATEAPESLSFSKEEIAAVADFGPPPASALATPAYALRVWVRSRALRDELALADRACSEQERARDDLLARILAELRPELERDPALQGELAPVREEEARAREALATLQGENQEVARALESFDRERDEIRARAGEHHALRTPLERRVEEARAVRDRHAARVKRARIEARSAQELLEAAAARGAPPPPEAHHRMAAAEESFRAASPALAEAEESFAQATRELARVDETLAGLDREERAVEQRRRRYLAEARERLESRSQSAEQAEASYRSAAAGVMRRLLALRGSIRIEDEQLAAIAEADDRVRVRLRALELLRRALDAFDRDRARQGWQLLGTAGALVLVLLVWLVLG